MNEVTCVVFEEVVVICNVLLMVIKVMLQVVR